MNKLKPSEDKWLFRTKTRHSSTSQQTWCSPAGTARPRVQEHCKGQITPCCPFHSPGPARTGPGPFSSSWCYESSENDGLLFIFCFLDTKSLWLRKHFSHIPGPMCCPYCHFSGHRPSYTPFCSNNQPWPSADTWLLYGSSRLAEVWRMGKIKTIGSPLTPCWLVMVRGKVWVEWTTCVPNALPDCWECW